MLPIRCFLNSMSALLLSGMLSAACGTSHSDPAKSSRGDAAGHDSHVPVAAGDAARSGKGGTGEGGAGRAGVGGGSNAAGRAATAGESSSAGRSANEEPIATKFVVRNDGDDALMLGSNCGVVWPALFEGDNQLGLVNSCSCPCEDRSVCGCPAVCLNTQELVVPGKSVTRTWDGTALDYSTDMTRSCFVERVPPTGTKLEVRACWNYGETGMPQACSAEWFAYGRDTEVTLSAKPAAATGKTTTVGLTNASGDTIYVVKERCGSQDWFRLDMGKEISVNTFCPCSCDASFHATSCPACGACAPDVFEAVAPGATIQFEWDSRFWYRYDSLCAKPYNMPRGSQVKVQLCWSKTPGGEPICQPTVVDIGARTVLSAG
jgi:hypothetical protein